MEPSEEDLAWFKSTFHPVPKPALPDDCIEYSLYVIHSSYDRSNDSELRVRLREVQKYANELQRQWLKDYIWQRQGFALELVKEDGLSSLRGRTEFGDSIEDEWVIVWLLRELTKKFEDLWVKVTDSDGEFLLIEASGTIPEWLEPEVAENRVWINNGQLKIIKPSSTSRSSKRTSERLDLEGAQQVILSNPKRIMQSTSIEEEAFYRLRNYPQQIKENMHHALIRAPRNLAYLLQQKPAYVAPAIEAFYLRDPIALKPLQDKSESGKLTFPPQDLVTIITRFPKVGYAQLRAQDFPAPSSWKSVMPGTTDSPESVQAYTGMKLTCGFEMLLSDTQYQDKPLVREMKLLLEDVESGDAELPTDADIAKSEQKADDEKWLNIDFEDLQHELGGAKNRDTSGKKREFGDPSAQENLQRIVKQFEDFLNDDKGGPDAEGFFGGDDDDSDGDLDELDSEDSDDGEDKDASFGEDEFSRLMQEMMGMPPAVMKELMSGKLDALSNGAKPSGPLIPPESTKGKVQKIGSDEEEVENVGDMQTFMHQMEAELKETGVLDLGKGKKSKAIAGPSKRTEGQGVDDEESSEDEDVFADMNGEFARNLLESFRSQRGGGGPTTTLMSLLDEKQNTTKSGQSKQ